MTVSNQHSELAAAVKEGLDVGRDMDIDEHTVSDESEAEINAKWDAYVAALDGLVEQLEAVGVEYVCAHDHKWHTLGLPTRCPMCNTSTFAASSPASEPRSRKLIHVLDAWREQQESS